MTVLKAFVAYSVLSCLLEVSFANLYIHVNETLCTFCHTDSNGQVGISRRRETAFPGEAFLLSGRDEGMLSNPQSAGAAPGSVRHKDELHTVSILQTSFLCLKQEAGPGCR